MMLKQFTEGWKPILIVLTWIFGGAFIISLSNHLTNDSTVKFIITMSVIVWMVISPYTMKKAGLFNDKITEVST